MNINALENLKEKLCKELDNIASKNELSAAMLDTTDKLTRTVKNIDKLIMMSEEMDDGYSGNYGGRGYSARGYRDYRGGYGDGMSGARGRRNVRRDAMGRYSGDYRGDGYSRHDGKEDMVEQLREMMADAPDEKTRQELQKLVRSMEQD